MADRDILKRIDRHMERGNELVERFDRHMERGNELTEQNREAFERNCQEIERSREAHESFRIFLRDLTTRNERVLGQLSTRIEESGRALRDLQEEVRAHTDGMWAMVDQIQRLGPGGEGAAA